MLSDICTPKRSTIEKERKRAIKSRHTSIHTTIHRGVYRAVAKFIRVLSLYV